METSEGQEEPPQEQSLSEPNIYVSLTHAPLDPTTAMSRVKSPKAGAVILFAGTTRATFQGESVLHLNYTAYAPLALQTMLTIARAIHSAHNLVGIAITHRLGKVGVGEESVLIAVSSPHRAEAWRAGEECLERVKDRVEVWKEEWLVGGGMWRSNRDGGVGVPVVQGGGEKASNGDRSASEAVGNGDG